MGAGIAHVAALKGIRVVLSDINQAQLDRAIADHKAAGGQST